ncbi:MAG: hypothetical protein P8X65_12320 [Syntrophobacterales bacterium]
MATAIHLANTYPNIIPGVVVGNEWSDKDFAPGPVTVAQMQADLQNVRSSIPNQNVLVTTCFGFNAALNPEQDQQGRTLNGHYPGPSYGTQLQDHVDNMMFTSYPFFAGINVNDAYADSKYWYDYAVNLFPGKQVFMGELGWPTAGPDQTFQNPNPPAPPPPQTTAVPSVGNEQTYDTALLNNQQNPDKLGPVFLFEAFDEPWKKGDAREPYWGLWTWTDPNTSPTEKFPFTVPGFPQAGLVGKQWIGPNPNSLWSNPDNWDPAGVPAAGDDVLLTIDPGSQTVLYNVNSSAPLLNSLTIDATGGGTITLQQFGNDLSTGGEVVGRSGQGIHNQFGGHNMVNGYLILGRDADSHGTYNLYNNGSLSITYTEIIGNSGTGTFTHIGGTHIVADELFIGETATGSGTYKLIGGSLSTDFEIIGDNGTGSFKQIGGSHTVGGSLMIGFDATGSGSYNLISGILSSGDDVYIGLGGTGTFIQSSGTHLAGELFLGFSDNSWGSYQLLSGSLQSFSETIGPGSFIQKSGLHTVSNDLVLGKGGSGNYLLTSGQLSVGMDEVIGDEGTGSFTHTSGNHTVNGNLTLGKAITDSGNYLLTSGQLSVGMDEVIGDEGTGSFTQLSGNNTVNGDLYVGRDGSGTYNLKVGTLKAANEFISPMGIGIFNQTGGLNTVTNELMVGSLGGPFEAVYNLKGGTLIAGSIRIEEASFNVMNVVTTVTGDVFNRGDVRTTNAMVTWNGNFTNDALRYTSNSSKQTFKKDLVVNPDGAIVATHSQDLFVIKNNFVNSSEDAFDWNTVQATLKFATGADNTHDFYIPGADNGPPGDVPVTAVTDNFAWGTLDIAGQTVHLFDGNDTPSGAQYVGRMLGASLSGLNVTNIFDTTGLNIYYDPDLAANFYLHGLTYDLAGIGSGKLIPFHTPLPPSVFLLGSGLLGLGLLGWRRKRG